MTEQPLDPITRMNLEIKAKWHRLLMTAFATLLVVSVLLIPLLLSDYQYSHDPPEYMKDERTGICFALFQYGRATVPCDKVQHLIDGHSENSK